MNSHSFHIFFSRASLRPDSTALQLSEFLQGEKSGELLQGQHFHCQLLWMCRLLCLCLHLQGQEKNTSMTAIFLAAVGDQFLKFLEIRMTCRQVIAWYRWYPGSEWRKVRFSALRSPSALYYHHVGSCTWASAPSVF